MRKACAVPVALYLMTAAAIGAAVYRRFPVTSTALISAFIGGFFVFLAFAYLFGIRGRVAEARMIRRAESGLPPRDGEKVAAIGRLAPTGAPVNRTIQQVGRGGVNMRFSRTRAKVCRLCTPDSR